MTIAECVRCHIHSSQVSSWPAGSCKSLKVAKFPRSSRVSRSNTAGRRPPEEVNRAVEVLWYAQDLPNITTVPKDSLSIRTVCHCELRGPWASQHTELPSVNWALRASQHTELGAQCERRGIRALHQTGRYTMTVCSVLYTEKLRGYSPTALAPLILSSNQGRGQELGRAAIRQPFSKQRGTVQTCFKASRNPHTLTGIKAHVLAF